MCEKKEEYKTDDLTNILNALVEYSVHCKDEQNKAEKKIIEFCDLSESNEDKHDVGIRRIWKTRADNCERAIDAIYSGRIGLILENKKEAEANGDNQQCRMAGQPRKEVM